MQLYIKKITLDKNTLPSMHTKIYLVEYMVHQVIKFNFAHNNIIISLNHHHKKVLNVASPHTDVRISNILDIRTKGGRSFIK